MTPRTRLLVVVATCSVLASATVPPAYAAASRRCFGRRPTIVASGRGHHRIKGTGGADVILVTRGRATVNGHRGDDRICTAGRGDRIRGGKGDDRIRSGRGWDEVWGGRDHDVIRAGGGNDSVDGGHGFDHVWGGSGSDSLAGGDWTDHIRGGKGGDGIDLGPGDPESESAQTAFGGPGNDEIDGSNDPERVYGGTGDDVIYGHLATTAELVGGTDRLAGQDGDDHIVSGTTEGAPVETFSSLSLGGEGVDVLEDLDGGGTLEGGPGDDVLRAPEQRLETVLSFENASAGVVVDLSAGIATGEGTDVLSGSFAHVWGSPFEDELVGDAHANGLSGRDGDDNLRSGGGDDRLTGGGGDDVLAGGPGEDEAAFAVDGELTVDLSRGMAEGDGSDVVGDVENVMSSGHPANHHLIGDDGVNRIYSSASSVRMEGRGGDDEMTMIGMDGVVDAGGGNDFVWAPSILIGEVRGGSGDDAIRLQQPYVKPGDPVRLDGGAGTDVIDFRQSSYAIRVDLASHSATFETGRADTTTFDVFSFENVFASGWPDVLIGDDGPNRIVAFGGDDVVEGRGGDDDLDGGDGNDDLDGGDGNDRCTNGERLESCEG